MENAPAVRRSAAHYNRGMGDRTRGYAHRVDITADVKTVWHALTNQDSLTKWCSPEARIRPRTGGSFSASVDRVTELEAHIDVFDAGRRLRLIYLPNAALPPGDSAVVDDFILEPSKDGVTIVRLLGSGYPDGPQWEAPYRRARTGWERAMARLKVFVEKTPKEEAK
jgi:uncharacterized protein YndB with AHSA1/START domain